MFDGKPLAGAADAALHFVDDEQDAVLVADAAQLFHEDGGRDDVSAFALNWFNKNGGDFFGGENRFEQFVFDEAGAAERKFLGILRTAFTTAIDIGVANVGDSGHERRETALLLRLGAGERERTHGASVERAEKGDDLLSLGVIAREFQGAFDGFGSGVSVINFVWALHGRDRRQALGEGHERLVIKIGTRHVDQFAGLLLNGGDDVGMAMSGGGHGDAGGEIEELVAIDIFDDNAASALGHERIGTRVGGRDIFFIARKNALGVGPGKRGDELGADELGVDGRGFRGHGSLQVQVRL